MGKQRKMCEKLQSTKQIFLYSLSIANSMIHVREFFRKRLEYMIITFIIIILILDDILFVFNALGWKRIIWQAPIHHPYPHCSCFPVFICFYIYYMSDYSEYLSCPLGLDWDDLLKLHVASKTKSLLLTKLLLGVDQVEQSTRWHFQRKTRQGSRRRTHL